MLRHPLALVPEKLIKRLEGQVRALRYLDILVAHHARRMSNAQRWYRIADADGNQLWKSHLITMGDDAFRQCGKWSNERRRARAYSVLGA